MNNFIIKDTVGKGKGLFSSVNVPANHVIFEFVGSPITIPKDKLKDYLNDSVANCWLQVGSDTYLDLDGHYGFFTNHSCSPNCYIRITAGKVFLVSINPIQTNEELTFDYSSTSTDTIDTWFMPCNCSLFRCRKVITGFQSLSDSQQKRYIDIGAVPNYVVRR